AGIEYNETVRKMVGQVINSSMSENNSDLENETKTVTQGYEKLSMMPSAWDSSLKRFLTIEEFCDRYGLDKTTVKSSKLISHVAGHMTYNIVFYTPEEEVISDIENSLDNL